MVKTYKYKSKIATAIAFIAALIAYLGQDGLNNIMPPEYAWLIPVLVFCAGYILTQTTENKRVDIAEQMIIEKYAKLVPTEDIDPAVEYETLNKEYNIPVEDEENGC